jgi:hypothetical protein
MPRPALLCMAKALVTQDVIVSGTVVLISTSPLALEKKNFNTCLLAYQITVSVLASNGNLKTKIPQNNVLKILLKFNRIK